MAVMIGYNAIVGLAEEVTWGTEVTPSTHWLPIFSSTVEETRDIRVVPYLGVANAQAYHNTRDNCELAVDVGGDIETTLCYDSKAHLLLLKHAMGAVATSGAGPYTHTFTLDTDGVVGLSAHILHGSGVANPTEDFTGLRVSQLELGLTAREWMTMRATMIGEAGEGMAALTGTPAFAAAEEILGHHGATLSWNARTLPLRNFRLMIDNNLVRRPKIGSLYTDVPAPGGFASVTLEATIPWEAHDVYSDFRSGTQADATMAFTGTGNNAATATFENLRWTQVSKPINSAGELVFNVRAILQTGTSEQGFKLAIVNDNAAAI